MFNYIRPMLSSLKYSQVTGHKSLICCFIIKNLYKNYCEHVYYQLLNKNKSVFIQLPTLVVLFWFFPGVLTSRKQNSVLVSPVNSQYSSRTQSLLNMLLFYKAICRKSGIICPVKMLTKKLNWLWHYDSSLPSTSFLMKWQQKSSGVRL